jgi:nicotinamidase-related amidase
MKSIRQVLLVLVSLWIAAVPVAGRADGGTALVIIDMQDIFVTRGGQADRPENVQKVNDIHAAQIAAIHAAERAHMPIVFVEYSDSGVTNPVLTDAARGYSPQTTIIKNSDGVFDDPNSAEQLRGYLTKNHVQNLVITGANGGACVEASIEGALQNNYNVTAYNNGIADFNYDDFIYPYVNQYGNIHPACRSCTFRETASLTEAIPAPRVQRTEHLSHHDLDLTGQQSKKEPLICRPGDKFEDEIKNFNDDLTDAIDHTEGAHQP